MAPAGPQRSRGPAAAATAVGAGPAAFTQMPPCWHSGISLRNPDRRWPFPRCVACPCSEYYGHAGFVQGHGMVGRAFPPSYFRPPCISAQHQRSISVADGEEYVPARLREEALTPPLSGLPLTLPNSDTL